MTRELKPALSGSDPWCLSQLLYLMEVLDDEGRPVAERRAPSVVKEGVPIELKPCPYDDDRRGQPMNVSALAQITAHLPEVLADVAAFHRAAPLPERTWATFLTVVLDQLAGPALHLLRHPGGTERVPAARAVGHKLAAGYFGVARDLLLAEAMGQGVPYSVEGVLGFVQARHSLHGASEVCAGPLPLIARTSDVLLFGGPEPKAPLDDEVRVQCMRLLGVQIQLGVAYELFDRGLERRLLAGRDDRPCLAPRNAFIEKKLALRREELRAEERPPDVKDAVAALPRALGSTDVAFLSGLLEAVARARHLDDDALSTRLVEVLEAREGALLVEAEQDRRLVARLFGAALRVHRAFLARQHGLERQVRAALQLDPAAPVATHSLLFPGPRALGWLEAIGGYRVRAAPEEAPTVVLGNHKRTEELSALLGAVAG